MSSNQQIQLEAIWESVEVYLKHYEEEDFSCRHYGISNCPCCILYYGYGDCIGCPISMYTGETDCYDTPYMDIGHTMKYPGSTHEEKLLSIEHEYRFLVKVALNLSEEYMNNE